MIVWYKGLHIWTALSCRKSTTEQLGLCTINKGFVRSYKIKVEPRAISCRIYKQFTKYGVVHICEGHCGQRLSLITEYLKCEGHGGQRLSIIAE